MDPFSLSYTISNTTVRRWRSVALNLHKSSRMFTYHFFPRVKANTFYILLKRVQDSRVPHRCLEAQIEFWTCVNVGEKTGTWSIKRPVGAAQVIHVGFLRGHWYHAKVLHAVPALWRAKISFLLTQQGWLTNLWEVHSHVAIPSLRSACTVHLVTMATQTLIIHTLSFSLPAGLILLDLLWI